MSYRRGLWLALAILIVHNGEEYLAMSDFWSRNLSGIPPWAARLAHPVSGPVFLTMLIMVTLLAAVLVYVGTNERFGERGTFWGLVFIMGGLLANGMNHVGTSLMLGAYVPGLLSAVLLLLPYSLYLCGKALREKRTDIPTLALSLITGIALLLPTILVTRAVATWIFS